MKYIIFLFFSFIFAVNAQNTNGVIGAPIDIIQYLNPMQYNDLYASLKNSNHAYDKSQYLFKDNEEDFQIFFNENKVYSIKNLNYNINSKTLESKIGNDSIFEFVNNKILYFKHRFNIYRFYNFKETNRLYQELLVSQKIIFLKDFILIHKEAYKNPMTDIIISEASNEVKVKYYCKNSDSDFLKIDLKKKSVLAFMGDKYIQIKKFVNESKLSYNTESDLIKIFNYYNTL
jgi:hypothetical protein